MQNRFIYKLAIAATALAIVVVVLGAFTRLVDAGLGCPDWPGCYGHLTWPDSADEVTAAEARFPESPVEHDKTWPEMVHRYFAGTLGLFILAMLALAIKGQKAAIKPPLKLPIALVAMVILQGAFGMWTVTLKLWPQVVTAHLLGGFTTLSMLWLLVQRSGQMQWGASYEGLLTLKKLKPLALFGLLLVILQIALGGWTSSNYAAMACPDLPTCHGVWWPPADYAAGFNIFQHVGPNYLGGLLDNHARTAIHFSHRLGAIAVTVTLLTLVVLLWRSKVGAASRWAGILLAVLALQVTLGISNVHWVLPLPVAVAHNAVGAMLLLVMVTINHRLITLKSA